MTHTVKSGHFLLSALLPIHTWALMVSLAKKIIIIKKSKIPWHWWTTSCWLVFPPNGQLLSVDLIVLCYLACFTSHSPKYTHFHPLHTYTANSSCFQCCWYNLERLPQKLPHHFSKKKMFWSFFLIPGALLGLGGTHCGPRNLHYFWGGHAARLVGS